MVVTDPQLDSAVLFLACEFPGISQKIHEHHLQEPRVTLSAQLGSQVEIHLALRLGGAKVAHHALRRKLKSTD